MPIGGLKEKLLAAHRGNIKTVIIPKDNEKDLADVPANIVKALQIVLVDHMDDVLKTALVEETQKQTTAGGEAKSAASASPMPV